MIKRISTKYALLIMAVITAVTMIFIPVYMYVQKSMYINLEIQRLSDFCDEIVRELNFDNDDDIESYLEEKNEKSYTVTIYNSEQERIFTTQHRTRNYSESQNQPIEKIPKEYINHYSSDSVPKYYKEDDTGAEAIVLRKIIKDENKTYYVYLRERLRNVESIFAYSNQVLIVVLIMYIVVCGVLLFLLMSSLTKSIRSLNTAVKKMSQKDYSVRYEGKFPKDEVGTLASNFNDMANATQENINSISNYNFLLKEDINHLRQYENMRRQFVRNTTHELKTPLAIISSQVEMMKCIEDGDKRDYYYQSAMDEIQKM
ncbi:MAG: HAMP domain-containing protein, partial [Ruminococcus sp.]|nr:HAMP domain-containing protein [Ruminococcus sp.]